MKLSQTELQIIAGIRRDVDRQFEVDPARARRQMRRLLAIIDNHTAKEERKDD